jgi:drug/metabolite transporter (DMT)-like permease
MAMNLNQDVIDTPGGYGTAVQEPDELQPQVPAGVKHSAGLHLKTYILIFFIVIFAPLGNVFLSKGMKTVDPVRLHDTESLVHIFVEVFSSPYILLGIGFLLLFFVSYLLVLSWADYSYVQPASATSYAVVALLGHFALKEPISAIRWMGVSLICLGVLVVGNTHPRTTEHR